MSEGIARRPGKFRRCVLAAIRALCSVKDLYVGGMILCAGGQLMDAGTMGQQADAASLQPMLMASSDDADAFELVRSSSLPRARSAPGIAAANGTVPRSRSVAIGRIDEDHSCDFDDDLKMETGLLFPRSKSLCSWK